MASLNRRHFLLGSAVAAQATFAQSSNSDEKVGTAVIGTGGRGSYLLGGVLQQPNAKVIALCDIKPDRLDKAATSASRDNPATTTDWHKILDRKDVQAVFIATPPYLHAEMAMAALRAGKHVYCEKPIGITPASIRELVKVARNSKTVFQAGQQLRSMAHFREGVEKIHSGAIGDVIMVKAQRHASADLPHDGSSGDWYFDVTKGGGYLVEQSVHNLDLCNWIINRHPVRASGFGGINLYKNDPPGRTIMDHVNLTYDYADGVQLSFTQNVFHPRSMPNRDQYIYVYGTKGAVDFMTAQPMFYPLERDAKPSVFVEKRPEDEHAHIVAFYDCIQKGAKSPAGIVEGATAALTAVMGQEAAAKQKIVDWKEFGVEL